MHSSIYLLISKCVLYVYVCYQHSAELCPECVSQFTVVGKKAGRKKTGRGAEGGDASELIHVNVQNRDRPAPHWDSWREDTPGGRGGAGVWTECRGGMDCGV